MSRKLTNDISLVQSQLGLSRSKIIRLQDLTPQDQSVIQGKLNQLEQDSRELSEFLDELESKDRKGVKS